MAEVPDAMCPRCRFEIPDQDGFGVLYCPNCKLCKHAALTGNVCDFCGERVTEPQPAGQQE